MDFEERENELEAWWLQIAPSRQQELLMVPLPPMPWLDESIAEGGFDAADMHRFLHDKRGELEPTRDSGLNPRVV